MATITVTAESGLQARIREAETVVREKEQELEATVHEIRGAEDLLADLQSRRSQECVAVAEGHARATPAKFDSQIQGVRDRLAGLASVKQRREKAVADSKIALYDATAELGRIENDRAIRDEGEAIKQLISQIESAIEARDRAERTIREGVHKLRSRRYLAEANRRTGADASFRLTRLWAGMRA
jgi:hypothetical protein